MDITVAIPTLGQWGFISLVIVMGITGFVALRKKLAK